MLISPNDAKIAQLYLAQDNILQLLAPALKKHPQIRLSGGTVLSREWLTHRLSFDLDFFVPQDFPLPDFAYEIKKSGFIPEKAFFEKDSYQQLFGMFVVCGQKIEVSFIQDRFHHLFTPVFGGRFHDIPIEDCLSIYKRKTAIIIGLADNYRNGRSQARDLFDLYVLSKKIMPLAQFVAMAWGQPMLDNFYEGLANVDPMQIISDPHLYAYPEWQEAENVESILSLVMNEVGMSTQDIEAGWQENCCAEGDQASPADPQ